MMGVRRHRILLTQTLFVDDDGNQLELGCGNQLQQLIVKRFRSAGIAQSPERAASVDDVLAMENHWLVWVVRNVLLLECFQAFVDLAIVIGSKPTA